MPQRPRHSRSFLALAVVVLAACGGAIDNGDLFSKDQGTSAGSSGSSGATTTPTATAQPTASATPKPTPSPPTTTCGTSFVTDVMAVFQQTGCSNLECHGGPLPRNEPRVDTLDAAATYKALLGFVLSVGSPYVVQTKDPKDSSISCNLRDNCGVGMPLGRKITSKQLAVVDAWLTCGAPFN